MRRWRWLGRPAEDGGEVADLHRVRGRRGRACCRRLRLQPCEHAHGDVRDGRRPLRPTGAREHAAMAGTGVPHPFASARRAGEWGGLWVVTGTSLPEAWPWRPCTSSSVARTCRAPVASLDWGSRGRQESEGVRAGRKWGTEKEAPQFLGFFVGGEGVATRGWVFPMVKCW